ncbi:D-glycerate dehydrogenase [Oxalobacteraceae bacterium R-40]|uniref:D-glycerate dehydrogenase n=1 Tax=Keguizhuia sedimenti TaxID=3064264 RepID=A0ABU1BRR5_9BURK|nr:D-glycerate dehydrogenase [Oxalobacteraceae bacterium R-40]
MKPKILVARAIFPDVIARLSQYFEVESNQEDKVFSEDELAIRLQGKQGIFATLSERIGSKQIQSNPQLKAVCNMAVGYNNIDIEAATRAGIAVTNTPDVLNETTADFAWALLMSAARRVTESERWLREGKWEKWRYDSFLGMDLHGSTLGVLGMGRIGQAIARRSMGFNMRVIYHNRSRLSQNLEDNANHAQYVGKEELFKQADHVVLTVPYSSQLHHIVGRAELALMKKTATLVNIARGGIVDDQALIQALKERRIGAAGLDVFENEPAFYPEFLDLPNAVLTPHIASASERTRRAMADCAADNLIAILTGQTAPNPVNSVNPASTTGNP